MPKIISKYKKSYLTYKNLKIKKYILKDFYIKKYNNLNLIKISIFKYLCNILNIAFNLYISLFNNYTKNIMYFIMYKYINIVCVNFSKFNYNIYTINLILLLN